MAAAREDDLIARHRRSDENGVLTTRTSPDFTGIDDNGSPWYTKGQLLLSNRFTIAGLMKDLDSTAAATGGGVFGYFDAANGDDDAGD